MPPMPKEHIKILIRLKGGLNVTKTGPTVIGRAIVEVAGPSQTNEDVICTIYQQNIVIASTPDRHNADKRAFTVVLLNDNGEVINSASTYTTQPEIAEQLAIPLALLDPKRSMIHCDSRAAVRAFAKGVISRQALAILDAKDLDTQLLCVNRGASAMALRGLGACA
ncbi:hypothetical protein HPB49_023853 [Dermacentor silvarum]|uniref:Uncharacterized protein n=1 Tax=Dermacentor silvarum TaxID=543639 RepID=A0ACB8D8L8_DERSI|nr:hypothetical protein HPB49_023853 [Dermacentor silvarum]